MPAASSRKRAGRRRCFADPRHPYTLGLLGALAAARPPARAAAVPARDPRHVVPTLAACADRLPLSRRAARMRATGCRRAPRLGGELPDGSAAGATRWTSEPA